ncbi:hypothetical protein COCNU_09G005910 [Cocos nucifera]|uniref:Uncharacterized protein n=1 Tax=Cocos nucifera TaxID=13894 RepID=A0A8K0N7H4_COCNU|nr:hypothetical protein COCNU_09G005910 [Cocos nucifera]
MASFFYVVGGLEQHMKGFNATSVVALRCYIIYTEFVLKMAGLSILNSRTGVPFDLSLVLVEFLKKDKENLRINLHRAEEEVKVLFEENKILDEENKRLLRLLKKERNHRGSDSKSSAGTSTKGKRKSGQNDSSPTGRVIDFNVADSSRQPLSPLHQNSPDSRMHKK